MTGAFADMASKAAAFTDNLDDARAARWFAAFALIALVARVASLFTSSLELGPDETQYWFWSRTPAFGYYSKPPFIAWTIAATTALFGDAPWAVRLAAPFFHVGAAGFLFLLARKLYGPAAGLWTGVAWLTLPGVFLSSALIATDAPLLFFWSAALYCFFSLIREPQPRARGAYAFGLGASVGLGLLSKYAMVYFPLGIAGAALVDPSVRRALTRPSAMAAAALAGAIAAPNVLWNAANDFRTLAHTADNANWGGDLFRPLQLLEFVGAQFGVVGPVLAPLIALATAAAIRGRFDPDGDARALVGFVAPTLAIVAIQAFISRAHANWAAAAYPAGLVLAVAFSLDGRARRALGAAVALHLAAGAGFLAALASPSLVDALGAREAAATLRGWAGHGADVAAAAKRGGFETIMADDREILGGLVYYARSDGHQARFVAWNSNNRIDDHYEAFHAYDPARDGRALYVTEREDALGVRRRFAGVSLLGESVAPLGGGAQRTLYLFEVTPPVEN